MRCSIILILLLLSTAASAREAAWVSGKRSPNKLLAVFASEDGPVSMIYVVHRKQGRYLLDLVLQRGATLRASAYHWNTDSTSLRVTWKGGNAPLTRVYDLTRQLPLLRELRLKPSRQVVQLGLRTTALAFGWNKAQLDGETASKALTDPRQRLLAFARLFKNGGYLAKHLVKSHVRANRTTRSVLDPSRTVADLLAYATTVLLVEFTGILPARKLQDRLRKSFNDREILFIKHSRASDCKSGVLRISAPRRNRWEAKKLGELIKEAPSLASLSTAPTKVVLSVTPRTPPAEIRVVCE